MPAAKWLDERPALKEQASFAAASGSTDLIRSPVTGRTCHRAVSGGKINAGFRLCGKSPQYLCYIRRISAGFTAVP